MPQSLLSSTQMLEYAGLTRIDVIDWIGTGSNKLSTSWSGYGLGSLEYND